MLRGRRAAIAGAVAIAVAVVATGCGGGGNNSTHGLLAVDPVAAAATKTEHAGASRIRFSMAIGGPQGKTIRMHGAGAIDGTSEELSFNLGSMLGQMGLPAGEVQKFAHASMKAVVLKQDGDYVMYMDLGLLASHLPGGKQWMKLDFSKLGKSAGYGSLFSGSELEPSDLLALLKAEGAHVQKVGTATIDGTATTHYSVTIDLAKALQSKGVTSPMFKNLAARMTSASDDVWIGKDGLVRRITTTADMPALKASMTMTLDFYDYGAHIAIAAPPSSEVYDGTQLAQKGISGSLP